MNESFAIKAGNKQYSITPKLLNGKEFRFEVRHDDTIFWMEHYINGDGNKAWRVVDEGNVTDTSQIPLEQIGEEIDSCLS